MAKRDILKEAIADAKTVKETAIANAKAALEEAFTPQLKSMLATKLEEIELEEEMEDKKKKEMDEGHGMKMYDEDDSMKEAHMDMDGFMSDREDTNPEERRERNMVRKMRQGSLEEEELDEEINLDEILAELDEEMEKDNLNEDEATDKEEEGFLDGKKDGEEEEKEDI